MFKFWKKICANIEVYHCKASLKNEKDAFKQTKNNNNKNFSELRELNHLLYEGMNKLISDEHTTKGNNKDTTKNK